MRLSSFFVFFLCVIYGHSQETFYTLTEGKYGYNTLASKDYSLWKYYVPSGNMAVFTLKNTSSSSDFDIYIYTNEFQSTLLASGTNSGITTELVTLSPCSYGRYFYVKVKNDGRTSGTYNFFAHYVDLGKIGETAFVDASAQYLIEEGLKWLLGVPDQGDNSSDSERNISRASNLILSGLKGENLGGTTKSFILNEITSELRVEFGYGFWGNLLVSFAINTVNETYKNYW